MIRPKHYESKEGREAKKERDKRSLIDTIRMAEQASLVDSDSEEKHNAVQNLYKRYREEHGHDFPKPKLRIKK